MFIGASASQVFAIGALAINSFAFVIAPLFGMTDVQGIELEQATPLQPNAQPQPSVTW